MYKIALLFIFLVGFGCKSLRKSISTKDSEEDKFTIWLLNKSNIKQIRDSSRMRMDYLFLVPDSTLTISAVEKEQMSNSIFLLPKEFEKSIEKFDANKWRNKPFFPSHDVISKPYYFKSQNKILVTIEHRCGDLCDSGSVKVYEITKDGYILIFSKGWKS